MTIFFRPDQVQDIKEVLQLIEDGNLSARTQAKAALTLNQIEMQEKVQAGFFPVLWLHRDDIARNINQQIATKLDDGDMFYIVKKLSNALLDFGYWESLRTIVEDNYSSYEEDEDESE